MKISVETIKINAAPEISLDSTLYIPDSPQKMPCILFRTPYSQSNIHAILDPISIVNAGFSLLTQDVRGRFGSDGQYEPFLHEQEDGTKTVQWICAQPWSNGHVYTIGVSYEGFTAFMSSKDPAVKAIAPIMSSPRIQRDWFHENGCVKQAFLQSWAHSFAFTDNKNLLTAEQIDRVQRLASRITDLYQGPMEQFPASEYLPYYRNWLNQEDSEYWNRVNDTTELQGVDTAGYYLSGWYDIFCEGTLKTFRQLVENSRQPQKLVVGPWSHMEIFSSVVGDLDFGVYSLEKYSPMDIFNWFLEIENGGSPKSEIWLYVMGIRKWYRMDRFPVPQYRKLYMQSSGSANTANGTGILSFQDKQTRAVDTFSYRHCNLVPTVGGRCIDAVPEGAGGPKFQDRIENRQDVLVYTSSRLDAPVSIIGQIQASLVTCSTADQMDYCIKVTDVDDLGHSINILDSCLRITESADKKMVHSVTLGTIAHVFLTGHRIRCDITSSSFPRLNIQPSMLNRDAVNCVYTGNGEDSFLQLPIVDLS